MKRRLYLLTLGLLPSVATLDGSLVPSELAEHHALIGSAGNHLEIYSDPSAECGAARRTIASALACGSSLPARAQGGLRRKPSNELWYRVRTIG
jgi:hypothetical protein